MKIRENVYRSMLSCYSAVPPEQGGILGEKDGMVCAYIHDASSMVLECAVYRPDRDYLNRCIQNWSKEGIAFCGLVHSHPPTQPELSSADIAYIEALYRLNPQMKRLYFPLVLSQNRFLVYRAEIISGLLQINRDFFTLVR
ncbi:MAG: hypothetical protein ACSW8F_02725 [bacterium]